MQTELALKLIGAAATLLIAAILILRFTRQIGCSVPIIIIALVVGGLFAWSSAEQARATRAAANAATVASVGQAATSTLNSFLAGVLVTVILAGLGASGYLYLRWKLAERRPPAHQLDEPGDSTWLPGPNARWRRYRQPQPPTVYYVIPEPDEDDDNDDALTVLRKLDLERWGFR